MLQLKKIITSQRRARALKAEDPGLGRDQVVWELRKSTLRKRGDINRDITKKIIITIIGRSARVLGLGRDLVPGHRTIPSGVIGRGTENVTKNETGTEIATEIGTTKIKTKGIGEEVKHNYCFLLFTRPLNCLLFAERSRSRDRDREKERDRDRDYKYRSKNKDRERDKEKERRGHRDRSLSRDRRR